MNYLSVHLTCTCIAQNKIDNNHILSTIVLLIGTIILITKNENTSL